MRDIFVTLLVVGSVPFILWRPHIGVLIAARFVQGLFIPSMSTCLAAYLSRTLPPHRLNLIMGWYVSATVAGGMGVTILSAHAVQLELALGMLRAIEVEGFPVRRPWHVVWARERLLSPAAQAFRRFLHTADWRLTLPVPLGTE